MADLKTSQLTQLSAAPDTNDLLMVVDVSDTSMAASGTNKKLPAAYVARSAANATLIAGDGKVLTLPATGTAAETDYANTFTQLQTFNAYLASNKIATGAPQTMTNNQVRPLSDWVGSNLGYGLLIIIDGSNGPTALFLLRAAAGSTEISDPANKFSTAATTASSINVYYSGGIQIENKSGGTIAVYLSFIGL